MKSYELLIGKKTIDTYTCPICAKNDNSRMDMQKHVNEHEFRDLKIEVNWHGNTCDFKNEESARYFLEFIRYDNTRHKDWGDTYEQELQWTGPGHYYNHYESTRNDYTGDKHIKSTWVKLR